MRILTSKLAEMDAFPPAVSFTRFLLVSNNNFTTVQPCYYVVIQAIVHQTEFYAVLDGQPGVCDSHIK